MHYRPPYLEALFFPRVNFFAGVATGAHHVSNFAPPHREVINFMIVITFYRYFTQRNAIFRGKTCIAPPGAEFWPGEASEAPPGCYKITQIENFALSRECSSPKNAPVFFLFSSLLHFSSGSTMYIGRANFFEKRENATKTDWKIQKIPRPKKSLSRFARFFFQEASTA